MMTGGMYDQTTVTQEMGEFAIDRPATATRKGGKIALTVLNPEVSVWQY